MALEPSARKAWTEDETILALYLYFQTPFGRIHHRNPEIQKLAEALGRNSNSIAMKLANFASLDPNIRNGGRTGLRGASNLDRELYARFARDWDQLVDTAAQQWAKRLDAPSGTESSSRLHEARPEFRFESYAGPSVAEAVVVQRRGQDFFRRAVLANYAEACCITGIAEPKLLVASHILPWGRDVGNRHNPANGVLLSGTMDKAFDQGLLTIEPSGKVLVSKRLLDHPNAPTRDYFSEFHELPIRAAVRFDPDPTFLDWHNQHCFVDRLAA